MLTCVWAAAFEVSEWGLEVEDRMGRGLPEVAGSGVGELAHLLLGVHHWYPLEDTKGRVTHSHPALLPVGELGD